MAAYMFVCVLLRVLQMVAFFDSKKKEENEEKNTKRRRWPIDFNFNPIRKRIASKEYGWIRHLDLHKYEFVALQQTIADKNNKQKYKHENEWKYTLKNFQRYSTCFLLWEIKRTKKSPVEQLALAFDNSFALFFL